MGLSLRMKLTIDHPQKQLNLGLGLLLTRQVSTHVRNTSILSRVQQVSAAEVGDSLPGSLHWLLQSALIR
jgi:hypothetical protein